MFTKKFSERARKMSDIKTPVTPIDEERVKKTGTLATRIQT